MPGQRRSPAAGDRGLPGDKAVREEPVEPSAGAGGEWPGEEPAMSKLDKWRRLSKLRASLMEDDDKDMSASPQHDAAHL